MGVYHFTPNICGCGQSGCFECKNTDVCLGYHFTPNICGCGQSGCFECKNTDVCLGFVATETDYSVNIS